jgi:hypothetical protein
MKNNLSEIKTWSHTKEKQHKIKKGNPLQIPHCNFLVSYKLASYCVLRSNSINNCVVISDVCRSSQYHPSPINSIHPRVSKNSGDAGLRSLVLLDLLYWSTNLQCSKKLLILINFIHKP